MCGLTSTQDLSFAVIACCWVKWQTTDRALKKCNSCLFVLENLLGDTLLGTATSLEFGWLLRLADVLLLFMSLFLLSLFAVLPIKCRTSLLGLFSA